MPKKILIVDDEAEYRTLLHEFLTAQGFSVLLAPNGKEGLRLFHDEAPDLILLDVMLPDMLGFDFCAKVRAGKKGEDTPILFCTVRSAVSSLAKGVKAGGTDYVLKPFDPENVLVRVRSALKASQ